MLTSIDVKFTYGRTRLGLFSSANILQIADVAFELCSCCSCHVFSYNFCVVLTLETSEMSASFCFHKENNSSSSPGLLG